MPFEPHMLPGQTFLKHPHKNGMVTIVKGEGETWIVREINTDGEIIREIPKPSLREARTLVNSYERE